MNEGTTNVDGLTDSTPGNQSGRNIKREIKDEDEDDILDIAPAPKRARVENNPPATQGLVLSPRESTSDRPSSLPMAPQPNSSPKVEQHQQIERILNLPSDAYYDILSLANRTSMSMMIDPMFINLSLLVHPGRCQHPQALQALVRVNDAYAWISRHPGQAQPFVSSPLPPPMASPAPAPVPVAAPAPSASQPLVVPHDPWSGDLESPPSRQFAPRPSSHIYVRNGEPFIRPAVGWQFRTRGGETRVWVRRRFRRLIQDYEGFEGVRFGEDGWIVPILSVNYSRKYRQKIENQAKFEFNTHP
ncbi:hypothetical protein Daus18300_005677 [Diaporthe australafricana]|uniref:F-box domain-containing protein n=1 Tax=Diaporthe australafricana TaxID=127596 RepID=A0ABR3WZR1_9PEZI